MAEARGYNKGTPCYCRAFAHSLARSLARPFARSRFASGGDTLLRLPHTRNRKGESAATCAGARVERKKSAGLTTGDGRRIDRANIGDQECRDITVMQP